MWLGVNLLLTCLILAHAKSMRRSELTYETPQNLSFIFCRQGEKAEKQCVHSCVYFSLRKLGRSQQQLQVRLARAAEPTAACPGAPGALPVSAVPNEPSPLGIAGLPAPVICARPCQDQDILPLQYRRTVLWTAFCPLLADEQRNS